MLCFRCTAGLGPWLCGLKNLFQFAQGLRAREPWFAYSGFAAGCDVQHPERHFQNPTSLDLFQAAVRHPLAASYETGMQPHCPAMPWMPAIADFTAIPNMGVVLLSCITPSEITKASAIYSSFLIAVSPITTDSFDAEAASAEFLIPMSAPPDNSAHASFWTVRRDIGSRRPRCYFAAAAARLIGSAGGAALTLAGE